MPLYPFTLLFKNNCCPKFFSTWFSHKKMFCLSCREWVPTIKRVEIKLICTCLYTFSCKSCGFYFLALPFFKDDRLWKLIFSLSLLELWKETPAIQRQKKKTKGEGNTSCIYVVTNKQKQYNWKDSHALFWVVPVKSFLIGMLSHSKCRS